MSKRIMVAKLPHGWYRGKLIETDIIDAIVSSIGRYDIALVELADDNKIIERERERESSYRGSYKDGLHDGE